ncbi:MAG TPA: CBS domain-containing protein [Polyangiaceae bacterium]
MGDHAERPVVGCAFDQAPDDLPDSWPVGSVLAPFAYGVRMGALRVGMRMSPRGMPLAVVDDAFRFVAVCEPGPTVFLDNGLISLAIEEHVSLLAALQRLRSQRKQHAPVVSGRGTFLGTLNQSDVAHALRGPPRRSEGGLG